MSEVFNPGATYRIQFHKDFTFKHLDAIIPYLEALGIQTLYASPIFKAFPGSTHGYDGTDPNKINPEIGTEEELIDLNRKLNSKGIRWLQDIVPNHLAFHHDNAWLMDVFEKGQDSDKAKFFDIDWRHPINTGRLMVPFLAAKLEEEITNGNLQLAVNLYNNKYYLRYFNNCFLVNRGTLEFLQSEPQTARAADGEWQIIELEADVLNDVINRQHYELCGWFETDKRINFRRFFTVNGLICTNIQDAEVFDSYHQLIKKLIDLNVFDGLRIDHVDGLYDPLKYLNMLRGLAGEQTYIVVEKILAHREYLPDNWPIQGTSGYDFLAMVNNVLTNKSGEQAFTDFYHKLNGQLLSIKEEVIKKKLHILFQYMNGELDNLTRLYMTTVDLTLTNADAVQLRKEIAEYLIKCPVYRYYDDIPFMDRDSGKTGDGVKHFYQRCMQFTGPLMAKGVEDTLMYTYNRFIGHNDVGDSPEYFGSTTDEFHQEMQNRQQHWPTALNTTSTHDTKRGEDARARLNALSDLSTEWLKACSQWEEENQSLKAEDAPDKNDEYFIYQTLISTYPFREDEFESYYSRLIEYFPKAFREAKSNSNWSSPNKPYEDAAAGFIRKLFQTETFRQRFFSVLDKVKDYGVINSLIQTILKYTCPGVPDLYQGTEMWDLSLVDPDNRRPVDYDIRVKGLGTNEQLSSLWKSRNDGRIKLRLTQKLFSLRKHHKDLFQYGEYVPVATQGVFAQHILAFRRLYKNENIIVVVPLGLGKLAEAQKTSPLTIDWRDTEIRLKTNPVGSMMETISARQLNANGNMSIKELFSEFPMAVLRPEN